MVMQYCRPLFPCVCALRSTQKYKSLQSYKKKINYANFFLQISVFFAEWQENYNTGVDLQG